MDKEVITSRQNPRVKSLVKLLSSRSERNTAQQFIIEGERQIQFALDVNWTINECLICPELLTENDKIHLQKLNCQDSPFTYFSEHAFTKFTYKDKAGGLILVGQVKHISLDNLTLSPNPTLLIVENLEKPGNLGAILRSCDALGIDAVVCIDPILDLFNPNVVRASQGTLFSVPIVISSFADVITFLKDNKIQCIATSPRGNTLIWDLNLKQATAFVMGSEKDGITDQWFEYDCIKAKIPISGNADSLNLATSSQLFLYECLRQRNND